MLDNEFSYGGVESSTYNMKMGDETHSILPAQRKYIKEIPGLDGHVDFGIGGYGARIITMPIFYTGTWANLTANREAIIAWLANTDGAAKQLILGKSPTKYYIAKCYSAIEFKVTPNRQIGTIVWECNPPWQYEDGILLTPAEIAWNTTDAVEDNQYIKEFTASGSIRLTNTGTAPVKPIIKLLNNIPSGLTLTYGASEWTYNGEVLHDGIVIDCDAETVTRMSDGANLFDNVDPAADDYFELAAGQIEISVTATGLGAYPLNLQMIVQFDPVDLG